jgi:hypothetical protein
MAAIRTASVIDQIFEPVNVRAYGARGDGTTNDTAAVAAAYTAAAGRPLYFPPGTYLVTALPALVDGDRLLGAGPVRTEILYAGTGTLLALSGKQDIAFRSIGFALTGAGAKALTLAGCFQCSLDDVRIRGAHTGATGSTYHGQIGLTLSANTGNTRIHNSVFANLGCGVETSCIQNQLTNCKIVNTHVSVRGVGGTANAGLVCVACEFVGDTDPDTVLSHIDITGTANTWEFTGCWFEGSDYGLIVGVHGSGGPSSFAMLGCKIAARVVGIQFNNCRQPSIVACEFNADTGGTMTELVFNTGGDEVPEGIGLNNVTTLRADFADADYPQYWVVSRKGQFRAPNLTVSSNADIAGTVKIAGGSPGAGKVLTSDASGNAIWAVPDATQAELDAKAPLASPALTGTPTAPTAAAGTNTTQLATTAHVFAERANTVTLTNKRITPRIGTTASSATPTPSYDDHDQYNVTALAAGATFGAPTGTPVDGQKMIIRVKDNGTARTLAYNAAYRAVGVTLPVTTVISKTLYLGGIYNAADSKLDIIAVALEA